MNIYLISQSANCNYDTYDSAIIAADSEDQARLIHPSHGWVWSSAENTWTCSNGSMGGDTWVTPDLVKVELIGKAIEGAEAGVFLASFNAG